MKVNPLKLLTFATIFGISTCSMIVLKPASAATMNLGNGVSAELIHSPNEQDIWGNFTNLTGKEVNDFHFQWKNETSFLAFDLSVKNRQMSVVPVGGVLKYADGSDFGFLPPLPNDGEATVTAWWTIDGEKVEVPEPVSIFGTLAFGVGAVLKRKQNISKSTKKETAKVS